MGRTTIRTAWRSAALAALAVWAAACAGGRGPIGLELRESGRFEAEWKRYLRLETHKSLAFAGDVEGRYVIGYGYDEVTRAAAESAAIKDCEMRRADKRIETECRTVAVDDDLTDSDPVLAQSANGE